MDNKIIQSIEFRITRLNELIEILDKQNNQNSLESIRSDANARLDELQSLLDYIKNNITN